MYADSWVQYQHFHHHINNEDSLERYKTKGWTVSFEAGYNTLLMEHFTKKGNRARFYLQPQAQLIYLGVNGQFTDNNYTKVTLLGSSQLQSHTGIQAKVPFVFTNGVTVQPFAIVNVIYQSKSFGVKMDGENHVVDKKPVLESQLGVAIKMKSHLALQVTFNRQTGKYHHAKQGALKLQWTF